MFVNQITLRGNLGRDPETRYDSNGRANCRFNVAVPNRRKEQDGEWVDDTWWVRVTVFGPQAERLGTTLVKGSRVLVIGRMDTPKIYNGQNGQGIDSNLVASVVEPLDRPSQGEREDDEDRYERPVAPAGASQGRPRRQEPRDDSRQSLDDLPF